MSRAEVTLSSTGMGEATEADYDAWCSYVCERIDDLAGREVEVDCARFGAEVLHEVDRGVDDRDRLESILAQPWSEFCAGGRVDVAS